MSALERRWAALEVRDSGAVVEGVAMPYGSVARILGAFDERVEARAFSGLDDVTLTGAPSSARYLRSIDDGAFS